MLVKNLRLNFSKADNEKVILQTENGMEIILPESLLDSYDRKQVIYLAMDYQPVAGEESQKQVLNELLDNQE